MSLPEVNQANYHQRERGHGLDPGRRRKINYNHDVLHQKLTSNIKGRVKKKEVMQKKIQKADLKKDDSNPEANSISEDNVEPIYKMDNNAEANFISKDNVEPMHLDVSLYFLKEKRSVTSPR
ncbi:hypothetical protein R3W88_016187 [Solanum pinnatisectum]|uniref:Uncharacterized protein n=1 Tax=Solanum pinnatisectum TaxID=50273 RepID=A0AAV9KWV6_9SOLN|nr:hypothetical protein R3W88_016187 [Solanum pinnatisectum]